MKVSFAYFTQLIKAHSEKLKINFPYQRKKRKRERERQSQREKEQFLIHVNISDRIDSQ